MLHICYQAERKNMSEFQIGLVFAAFSMAGIFASIVTGMLVSTVLLVYDISVAAFL